MPPNRLVLVAAGAAAAIAIVGLSALYRSAARERDRPRKAVQALRRRPAVPPRAAPVPPPVARGPSAEEFRALEAEAASLRQRNADLEKRLAAPEKEVVGILRPPSPNDPSPRDVALDPSQGEENRVKALLVLRMSQPDGRTEEVVQSMLDLFSSSTRADLRADILRNLHRALPLRLKDPVLRALADPDGKVREEAAETLGPLKADPAVRAALEHAAKNDPESKVRRQAAASLAD